MAVLQFCTTSSRRYLAYTRALAHSLAQTHPGSQLWVLLTDDHDHRVDRSQEHFRGVWNEELGIDAAELHRMFTIHAREYHIAIKPWIIEHVLRETGGPVLFIDSDIQVYESLEDVGALIEEHGVVLTPHAVTPYPLDDKMPDDTTILSAGTFNAGMIGVGRRGTELLSFLKSRLNRESCVDVARMRVGEQRWLDYVPSFMPERLWVLRDTGVNVAYWNLHERPLNEIDGRLYAGPSPLRAFHFSGYDFDHPEVLSRHAGGSSARVLLENEPAVARLCASYRTLVALCGNAELASLPVQFDALPIGVPLDDRLRAVYRMSVLAAEQRGSALPPDGYDIANRDAFVAWARWAYPASGQPLPSWAQPPSLEDVVNRLISTTSKAVATLEARIGSLEANLRGLTVREHV